MSSVPVPSVVRAEVKHRRTRPFTYEFRHRTTMWLVDAAEPDAAFPHWLRPLARIRPEDHFARDDTRALPVKIRSFLDARGLPWTASRVLLLGNARSLGHVFDPLTTFFCFDGSGQLEGVLAEVHNTYGERHCYPLSATSAPASADSTTSFEVGKEFYVSPFFAVEGRYDIRTRLTGSQVVVAISLTQGDETVFTGSVRGPLTAATPGRTVRAIAADPVPSLRVAALIRWHGIRLWLRRLPVVPRDPHRSPEGMRTSA